MSDPNGPWHWWVATGNEPTYATDPLAAMQRMIDESTLPPERYAGPMHLLHHSEWEKAARGEPFIYQGVKCVLVDGHPVPKEAK